METSETGVWAAGDCVESHHRVSNRPVAIALGTHANKQGVVVGVNATGGDARFAGVIGTAVTKICESRSGAPASTSTRRATRASTSRRPPIEQSTRARATTRARPTRSR